MNLFLITPLLTAIVGLCIGIGMTWWRFQRQQKQSRAQLNRQQISNKELNDFNESLNDQLHSLRQSHDKLNNSYNKLYAELDEQRNQLNQAKVVHERYLKRIKTQQAVIQNLEGLTNDLQQEKQRGKGLIQHRRVGPMPKSHFSGQKTTLAPKVKNISTAKDDLKCVKGINTGIEKTLNHAGITTWVKLSRTNVEDLKRLLNREGRVVSAQYDPSTWPKQAELAARGHWRELKIWQRRWEEKRLLDKLVK